MCWLRKPFERICVCEKYFSHHKANSSRINAIISHNYAKFSRFDVKKFSNKNKLNRFSYVYIVVISKHSYIHLKNSIRHCIVACGALWAWLWHWRSEFTFEGLSALTVFNNFFLWIEVYTPEKIDSSMMWCVSSIFRSIPLSTKINLTFLIIYFFTHKNASFTVWRCYWLCFWRLGQRRSKLCLGLENSKTPSTSKLLPRYHREDYWSWAWSFYNLVQIVPIA